jgi:hypothetical protein
MTKNWSVFTVSLSILVAFTASASAECAWMLWQEFPVHSGRWSLRYPYEPPAFPTKKECDKAAQQAKATETYTLEDAVKRGRPIDPYSWFVCLPDTIDPRGPKGR